MKSNHLSRRNDGSCVRGGAKDLAVNLTGREVGLDSSPANRDSERRVPEAAKADGD